MRILTKIKIGLTTGLIAPMITPCNHLENNQPKIEKQIPKTESLAYLAYKNRKDGALKGQAYELPVLFGDEWAI